MKNIGIIYCPNHKPFTSPAKRWAKIAAALEAHGLQYDMIQSEKADSVERLVSMLLGNGYETIIIAGGDSALNDAVNCFMRTEKHVRERTALGVIPNGVMNDFASFWGFTYHDIEHAVASIAQRRVRKVDVGYMCYTNKRAEDKRRYFINCVNVGLLAGIQKLRQETRRRLWSRKLSFIVSGLMMTFIKKFFRVSYTINFTHEEHRVSTLCIGSAYGYGQTPNAVPYNGMLDITVVRHSALSETIGALYLFARGKILNHKRIKPYRSASIELEVPKGTPVSIDGHPMETPCGSFRITVQQEEINFIIEKR